MLLDEHTQSRFKKKYNNQYKQILSYHSVAGFAFLCENVRNVLKCNCNLSLFLLFLLLGDVMKARLNKLSIIGVILILILFILSMIFPWMIIVSKIGALLVYGTISYAQIYQMKVKGEDYEKSLLFSIAVMLAVAYVLFFT